MGKEESEFSGLAAKLGRLRWKDVPAEERAAHSEIMTTARWKDSTPEERKEAASKAAKARWAKAKAAAKKKGKK